MKRYLSALLFVVLAVFFISILLSTVDSAELFTPKDIPGTEMHKNPDALRQISREESANAFGMMQDFIDISDSIVVNLKIKNIDDAKEDLEEYSRLASRYNNLVINLDMDDSEIEEFRRNNKEQLEALKETVQDSDMMEDLKSLQIQYRESGDSDKFYSVTYEINALKEKMGIDTANLQNTTNKLTNSAGRHEVVTSHLEENIKNVDLIAGDDELKMGDIRSEEISIDIFASVLHYGDILNISGTVEWVYDEKAIEVFIDSRKAGETGAEPDGEYLLEYPVGKIKPGKHTVYSKTGISYSDVLEFEVLSLPGLLNLECIKYGSESGDNNRYLCSGNLTAGGIPVTGAGIGIFSGENKITDSVTGYDGNFSANITLREGTHLIKAAFDDPSYPVNTTVSREIEINISGAFPAWIIVLLILFFGISGYAGYYFLNRRKGYTENMKIPGVIRFRRSKSDNSLEEVTGNEPDTGSANVSDIPDSGLKSRYTDILSEDGYFAGYHFIRNVMLTGVSAKYGVRYKKSMTFREFMLKSDFLSSGDINAFVNLYEKLVYQGEYDKGDEWSLYYLFEKIISDNDAEGYLSGYVGGDNL